MLRVFMGIIKSFVQGAHCKIYLSCYNWFLQFLYYRRRNKGLRETVESMLSCSALERSYNLHIESIVKPCVSKNQKGTFAMWVWLERKSWKRAEAMEKSIPELKAEFVCVCVCVCVRERRKTTVFKVYKKCKYPIHKGF